MQNLAAMLSQHHGEVDSTFFKAEWIPLRHGVVSTGIFFNWDGIMFANIIRALEKSIPRPEAKGPPFYLFGFLLDALYASNQFAELKWTYTPKCPLVHIYC